MSREDVEGQEGNDHRQEARDDPGYELGVCAERNSEQERLCCNTWGGVKVAVTSRKVA